MFQQGDQIRDYVFPLATIARADRERRYETFLGTAFLIGDRGFAMTAAHVAKGIRGKTVNGMFTLENGQWIGFDVLEFELHPCEDVAVIRIAGDFWKSFFRISCNQDHSGMRYRMLGYPEDALREIVKGDRAIQRPDLVYTEGYVRRRTNHEIYPFIGSALFELSEIAGQGCSGSPVIKFTQPVWDVAGVCMGERINDRGTNVSYAVRADAFSGWIPTILGRSVYEESCRVSV